MRPGERISGRYEILRKIGSGGMANVYLTKDLILEREVAIKVLALNFQEDEESLRRFHREALATTELVHPNIVNIYDVGEGETPYIVMEYVDGMDLKKFIQKNRPVPFSTAIYIMDQILSGVDYAHMNHVIHRDLKPHNILIDKNGVVKITDFGIAIALSQNSITQTNTLLGSVHYLSPEQARGNLVTKQSDIYALGILLYEILTGEVPFDGESAVSIALKHFQNDLPSLKNKVPGIPQPLENVVLKATAKDPRQRYQTAAEMRDDLKTSLSPEREGEPAFVEEDYMDDATQVIEPLPKQMISKREKTQEGKQADSINQSSATSNGFKKKKRNKRHPLLWLIAFIVVCLIGVMFFFSVYGGRPADVAIPDIVNMTLEEAEAVLEEEKIEIGQIIEENSSEIEEGRVIRTSPKVGAIVKENSKVNLYISEGEELFEVKDYTGEDYEEIRAELTEIGFRVNKVEANSNTVQKGVIMDQSIDSGEEIELGDNPEIEFTVSAGPEPLSMRDLTGYTQAGVEDYARDNGLVLNIQSEFSEDVPEGQVIRQSPNAGKTIYEGEEITVVFSKGTGDIQFSEEVRIPYASPRSGDEENEENEEEDQNQKQANQVKIYIEDMNHNFNSPVSQIEITEDTTITLDFKVKNNETAKYRIVRDGSIIEESVVSP